jgi:hypothetical protein
VASVEETPAPHAEVHSSTLGEIPRPEPPPDNVNAKLPGFDEIYRRATFKSNTKWPNGTF